MLLGAIWRICQEGGCLCGTLCISGLWRFIRGLSKTHPWYRDHLCGNFGMGAISFLIPVLQRGPLFAIQIFIKARTLPALIQGHLRFGSCGQRKEGDVYFQVGSSSVEYCADDGFTRRLHNVHLFPQRSDSVPEFPYGFFYSSDKRRLVRRSRTSELCLFRVTNIFELNPHHRRG